MASITLCDRCGKEISRNATPWRLEVRNMDTQVVRPLFDLHPRCLDDLQRWLAQERLRLDGSS